MASEWTSCPSSEASRRFSQLWPRRTTVIVDGEPVELLSLPDLVRAKKTQRQKDWPMIARLVEANYFQHRDDASPERVRFWLLEMRTPALLIDIAQRFPADIDQLSGHRPLLRLTATGDQTAVREAIRSEEQAETRGGSLLLGAPSRRTAAAPLVRTCSPTNLSAELPNWRVKNGEDQSSSAALPIRKAAGLGRRTCRPAAAP